MKNPLIASVALSMLLTTFLGHASEMSGVSADSPSSSPSGTEVVFSADYDGETNLWITSIDGKSLREFTSSTNIEESPNWSSDGTKIVFSSRGDGVGDIWSIQKNQTNLIQLTSNSSNNWEPTWSPDGNKIAFVSDRTGSTNDIWIMNADGTGQRRVTTLDGQENHPSFSPDGNEIVFSHTVDQQATLKIIKTDGTGLRTLTSGSSRDWNPSWSKYGIVFSSQRSSPQSKIWVVQPDGSGLRQMGDIATTDPTWMPDGRILFTDEPGNSGAITTIKMLDPATGEKHLVTTVQGFLTPIDIRPGKTPNRINPKSGGKVSVAILSRPGFDPVASVKKNTLTFGSTGDESSLSSCSQKSIDINGDRQPDLVCRFQIRNMNIQKGDKIAILRFRDTAGVPYEGRDSIEIISTDDPDDDTNEE